MVVIRLYALDSRVLTNLENELVVSHLKLVNLMARLPRSTRWIL